MAAAKAEIPAAQNPTPKPASKEQAKKGSKEQPKKAASKESSKQQPPVPAATATPSVQGQPSAVLPPPQPQLQIPQVFEGFKYLTEKPRILDKKKRNGCSFAGFSVLFAVLLVCPMVLYACAVTMDFSKDEIVTQSALFMLSKFIYDATIYIVCFSVCTTIIVNIVRILVATSTYYEISLWITRDIYKQNLDDERTARRFERDKQILAEMKEVRNEQVDAQLTQGPQELVDEVFTQVTTEDHGKNEDDKTEKRDVIMDNKSVEPVKKVKTVSLQVQPTQRETVSQANTKNSKKESKMTTKSRKSRKESKTVRASLQNLAKDDRKSTKMVESKDVPTKKEPGKSMMSTKTPAVAGVKPKENVKKPDEIGKNKSKSRKSRRESKREAVAAAEAIKTQKTQQTEEEILLQLCKTQEDQ